MGTVNSGSRIGPVPALLGADCVDNQRRLRQLQEQLEALSLAIVEADPRWNNNATLPRRNRADHHNTVGAVRYTTGQA
jgi:hypothetical protein